MQDYRPRQSGSYVKDSEAAEPRLVERTHEVPREKAPVATEAALGEAANEVPPETTGGSAANQLMGASAPGDAADQATSAPSGRKRKE